MSDTHSKFPKELVFMEPIKGDYIGTDMPLTENELSKLEAGDVIAVYELKRVCVIDVKREVTWRDI